MEKSLRDTRILMLCVSGFHFVSGLFGTIIIYFMKSFSDNVELTGLDSGNVSDAF
jgi:hypothetical protein